MRSQKATKKQNGKCYILTPERYVRAEDEEEEEEGLDSKMLHLTAKLERQFAESAKLEALSLFKYPYKTFSTQTL